MKTCAIIPVKRLEGAKLRLSSLLSMDERMKLSIKMLRDVLRAITHSSEVDETIIISRDDRVLELARRLGVTPLREESEGLNKAVSQANSYCIRRGAEATIVVPADVPLVEAEDVRLVKRLLSNYNVVVSPSHDGRGTNLLGRRPPDAIDTKYGRNSFIKHVEEAARRGRRCYVYKSIRVGLDLDTPADLKKIVEFKSSKKESVKFLVEVLSRKAL